MGWLSKELGDGRASGRYFAQARGDAGFSFAIGVIGDRRPSVSARWPNFVPPASRSTCTRSSSSTRSLIAAGELYRLWTVTLVHAPIQQMPLHLIFNMYALYLAGPIVEQLYGRWPFLLMYLAAAAGGSLASFAFGSTRQLARRGVGRDLRDVRAS